MQEVSGSIPLTSTTDLTVHEALACRYPERVPIV